MVLKKRAIIVYDNRILVEYIDVLFREKFKINKDQIGLVLDFIKKEGEFILADTINLLFTEVTFFEYSHAEAQRTQKRKDGCDQLENKAVCRHIKK